MMSCLEGCCRSNSSVAVRAPRVDGGGVIAAVLANQLVEAVTEVLYLARAQHTPHAHKLGLTVMRVVPTRVGVGIATTSPLGYRVFSVRQKRGIGDSGGGCLGQRGSSDKYRPPEKGAAQVQGGLGIGGTRGRGGGCILGERFAPLHRLKGSAKEEIQAEERAEERGEK